jgi:hypothetical protein
MAMPLTVAQQKQKVQLFLCLIRYYYGREINCRAVAATTITNQPTNQPNKQTTRGTIILVLN